MVVAHNNKVILVYTYIRILLTYYNAGQHSFLFEASNVNILFNVVANCLNMCVWLFCAITSKQG